MEFKIEKKMKNGLGRAGIIKTAHGEIQTPAFIVVGTKATVKALTPRELSDMGVEAVLANTYHLYLEPGDKTINKAGRLNKYMNWDGPTMTDSGGFQAFSLGAAYGLKLSKFGEFREPEAGVSYSDEVSSSSDTSDYLGRLAKVDEDGVNFKSHIDGSSHYITPEKSIEIQHNIGADIMFAFDECTSPSAYRGYQKEAMDRTHRWAERSLEYHKKNNKKSKALFGIIQGGRYKDLREESAKFISDLPSGNEFDGFGIGGSFSKEDIDSVVGLVCGILPENKPRHLLGIGEPIDIFGGIENGIDTFDCVSPTRVARNASLYTKNGRINILNAKYREDFTPIDESCVCYTCKNYSRSYVAHLFRAKEILANTLASIHNVYFIVHLVKNIRRAILDETYLEFKEEFLKNYYTKK